MTGYGSGKAPLGQGRVVVDVRTVNHRFLDVRVRLPHRIQEAGPAVEKIARDRLGRGRVDIGARLEGRPLPSAELDLDRAREVFKQLGEVRDALSPDEPLPLSLLGSVPDLFRTSGDIDSDAVREALEQAATEACDAVSVMRAREGAALAAQFQTLLTAARKTTDEARAFAAAVPQRQAERLKQRIEQLLAKGSTELDEGRLEQEVAIVADRSDVTEEIGRLESHCDQIGALLDPSDEAVGRRLDFLLQEMGREANTLSAKSPEAALTSLAVDLKATIEQMREQAQNIL